MAKIDNLGPLASLENQTSAIQNINENFDKVVDAFDNTLSRDGSGPNEMNAPIDMNGNRLMNLPTPKSDSDPVRLSDIVTLEIVPGEFVIPGQTGNAGKVLSTTGITPVWADATDLPSIGDMKGANNLSELTDTAAARTALGLGSVATESSTVFGRLSGTQTWAGTQTWQGTGNRFTGDATVEGVPTEPRSIGFRGSPSILVTTSRTLSASDSGKTLIANSSTPITITIPASGIPSEQFVSIINLGTGAVAVSRSGGVSLAQVGVGGNADKSVAPWGMVTLYQRATNAWVCWGALVT